MAVSMLAACGSTGTTRDVTDMPVVQEMEDTMDTPVVRESGADMAEEADSAADSKVLILYYDYSENMGDISGMDFDAITSASLAGESPKGVDKNNLLVIVEEVQKATGADVFSVRQNETHDPDYDKMVMPAQDDINENRQFTFVEDIDDLEQYDTVYIGMPVWWSKLPQPMKQFVENHDLAGKTIIPFGIHRGSRFGQMIDQLKELAVGAEVSDDGYTVSATTANDEVRAAVADWLAEMQKQ